MECCRIIGLSVLQVAKRRAVVPLTSSARMIGTCRDIRQLGSEVVFPIGTLPHPTLEPACECGNL